MKLRPSTVDAKICKMAWRRRHAAALRQIEGGLVGSQRSTQLAQCCHGGGNGGQIRLVRRSLGRRLSGFPAAARLVNGNHLRWPLMRFRSSRIIRVKPRKNWK